MASPEQRAQFERFAPLLVREGVDVRTASVADLEAGMERAQQRHKSAVEQVRAVLDAHARGDTSAAGELLEVLEMTADASPPPIPDALTVASRFAQLAQSVAPELPAAVIAKVRDSARLPDAPDGMADLCDAVLLDCDAASGMRTVIGEHGPASGLYAAAAMTSAVFGLWSKHSGQSMDELIGSHA
ncbi:hypothetical protein [Dietzia sp. B32]|uniref:hypothetical protein n=1 Tax=Dietzia sp. B32 TaxID=2915130 RepID=UPI0021AE04E4|nr:hypothetical protein [Dietzia sp. B32]UVE96457.1 hypothetical protein L8M95_06740 [Dietzia sp. B32]